MDAEPTTTNSPQPDKKNAYLVSYDIRGSDARMTEELVQMGAMKVLPSAWIVCSPLTASAIGGKIRQHVGTVGGFFVIRVGYAASFSSPIADHAAIERFLSTCAD